MREWSICVWSESPFSELQQYYKNSLSLNFLFQTAGIFFLWYNTEK